MSADLLKLLAEKDAPEEKTVTIRGQKVKCWFRHISAGERASLYEGQKYRMVPGEEHVVDIDLGANERQRHLLVQFSACHRDGTRLFGSLEAVEEMDDRHVQVLSAAAAEVNREVENITGLGKR